MSSFGKFVFMRSCSKLSSSMTDVAFVAVLTCNLVDNIYSVLIFSLGFEMCFGESAGPSDAQYFAVDLSLFPLFIRLSGLC